MMLLGCRRRASGEEADGVMHGGGRIHTSEAPDARVAGFGRTLRRVRRERDLSQEAVALAAGLATKHVSEIERAKRDVRLTTLLQLADGLGLPASELLRRCEAERPIEREDAGEATT